MTYTAYGCKIVKTAKGFEVFSPDLGSIGSFSTYLEAIKAAQLDEERRIP